MQRQTSKSNRWTLMSVATMIMLLGSSVGCLSVKHHLRRHTLVATVAQNQHGRYYHCPHCGQIIPREGFNKCPQCFHVPAFHGYEATCWRQWPEGWGCPPESAAGGLELLQPGMVESDSDLQELPPADSYQAAETTDASDDEGSEAHGELVRPAAESDDGEASLPLPPSDVAAGEQKSDAATEAIPTADPVDAVPEENLADLAPPPVDEVTAADESTATTQSPAVAQQAMPEPADVMPEPQPVEAPVKNPALSILMPEPSQAEAPVESSALSVMVSETPQVETPVESPELSDLVTESSARSGVAATPNASIPNPAYEIQYGPIDEDNLDGKLQAEYPASAFDVVSRIPIPMTKTTLTPEQSDEQVKSKDPLADVPTLVRTPATVINVATASVGAKSILATAQSASHISPHDEHGPIPVRNVRLADNKVDPTSAESTTTDAKEEFPTPVKRVALPELAPSKDSVSEHLIPIRRIQRSELPVKIHR